MLTDPVYVQEFFRLLYNCPSAVYDFRMKHEQLRQDFLARIGDLSPFIQLLDLVPDVGFFLKDLQGRFIIQNRRAYECCHVGSEMETLGKTDRDFFPTDQAQVYMEGDMQVMRTGEPIINAIQTSPESLAEPELILFSKVPVRDREGTIIGVAGIHRRVDGSSSQPKAYGRISRAIDAIHHRFAESLDSAMLARLAGLSRSQFDRHFQRLFATTPHEYLTRVRVQAARNLLDVGDEPITVIALRCGFYDHSHFSRNFRRLMGVSPTTYRKRRILT